MARFPGTLFPAIFSHDLHVLTGAYVLDALEEGAEQDRFVRHLRRCHSCTSEVHGLRQVATAMAFAAAAEPPAELRQRVLLLASQTRQLPPEVTEEARHWWVRAWRATWRLLTGRWPGRWLTGGWLTGPGSWLPRLAMVTAVVAIVAAVVLGITLAGTEQQLNAQRTQNEAIAGVLAAPDAQTVSGPVSTGGTTTVVLSAIRHELVVSTSGLAALPAGKVYELWLIGPAPTPTPTRVTPTVARRAGLLPEAVSGRTTPLLASGLVPGDVLGMTVEPAGGTSQPTTTPILELKLTAGG
jgi:Anti-sigma-K factor rskA